jgi:hypothetical protein
MSAAAREHLELPSDRVGTALHFVLIQLRGDDEHRRLRV